MSQWLERAMDQWWYWIKNMSQDLCKDNPDLSGSAQSKTFYVVLQRNNWGNRRNLGT
jgi:hypothetical protein